MDGNVYILEKGKYTVTFYFFKYGLYGVKIEDVSIRLLLEKRKIDISIKLIEELKELPENFEYAKAIITGAVMIAMKYYR